MAAVDPYSPCPCGSGQKFKWCCHKVESYADKSQRLFDGGQIEAALTALDEGLRKEPDNPWLMLRKALIHTQQEQPEKARPLLERVLAKHAAHAGAWLLLVRTVIELDGPVPALVQLQYALKALPEDSRPVLANMAEVIGVLLGRAGFVPAALAHFELAESLGVSNEAVAESARRMLETNAEISPWLRNLYSLAPAPEHVQGPHRERFDQALALADQGLWSPAAAAFDGLAAEGFGPEAERNLALCRLWLADEIGAAEALGRYIARAGVTQDALDLEGLRQLLAPLGEDDQIDQMQLTWPLRDREGLLAILRRDSRIHPEGRGSMDPEDPESPEMEIFLVLDRPIPTADAVIHAGDVPRILGEVLIGQEVAHLSGQDDGKLDALSDRFTTLAGTTIPPAQPKTKRIGRVPRALLAVNERWLIPPGLERADTQRLLQEDFGRVMRERWAKTPMPYLGGRSPEQAARNGDAEVPLRAALNLIDYGRAASNGGPALEALRADLGIPQEPVIDLATVEILSLHVSRLHRVPAEDLDDERLLLLYYRARIYLLVAALDRASRAIAARPQMIDREEGGVDRVALYSDLINLALARGERTRAQELLEQGRGGDLPESRVRNAPRWDMAELRLQARIERPENWVPRLAIVLERYRDNKEASEILLANLLDMGLIRMTPNPDNRESMLMDTRPLQAALSRYGPKITTTAGTLGISATQGGIWTPEKEAASRSGGAIWTPGSTPPPAAAGPTSKIFTPGR